MYAKLSRDKYYAEQGYDVSKNTIRNEADQDIIGSHTRRKLILPYTEDTNTFVTVQMCTISKAWNFYNMLKEFNHTAYNFGRDPVDQLFLIENLIRVVDRCFDYQVLDQSPYIKVSKQNLHPVKDLHTISPFSSWL